MADGTIEFRHKAIRKNGTIEINLYLNVWDPI